MKRETVADRLATCSNRPAGFDYMRLVLATAVVCSHATNVSYGADTTLRVWESWWRPLLAIILPLFFCLSGFLVAGSLERCKTLISFLGLRVIRLMPALAVDTLLAAFVIGPVFTALPIGEYLRSPMLHAYFLNIVGDVHFYLPGVFGHNPFPYLVNGQLWTLPWELFCYLSLTALAFFGLTRNRWAALACVAVLMLAYAGWFGIHLRTPHPTSVAKGTLIECFLAGVLAYMFRDRIVLDRVLFALSAVVATVLLWHPMGDYFVVLPVTYMTVYAGLLNPRRIALVRSGDYSYGIFLYGFPIQQGIVAVLGPVAWYVALGLSLPIIFALAAASWWFVEKPALRLRGALNRFEAAVLRVSHLIPFGWFMMKPPVGPKLRRPPARAAG